MDWPGCAAWLALSVRVACGRGLVTSFGTAKVKWPFWGTAVPSKLGFGVGKASRFKMSSGKS